jgi:hypothetical protein
VTGDDVLLCAAVSNTDILLLQFYHAVMTAAGYAG